VNGGYLSANTFEFFGVPPLLGRWPTPEDTKAGAMPVFAMSYKLWTQQFNRDPKILGQTFILNGVARTLVAIMPPRFRPGWDDVWVTFPLDRSQIAADPAFRDAWAWPMSRLKPGVSLQTAAADLDVLAHQLAKVYPDQYPKQFKVTARSLSDRVLGPFKFLIYPLAGAVGLLLLIACSNVANLLLARATVREHQIAIRMAIGAGRVRIIRQFLVESFVLAASGCLAGWLFAYGGIRAMVPLIPYNFFLQEAVIELNRPVFLFALALAALTTLMCGLASAAQSLRGKLQSGLLRANKGAGADFRHGKLRSALVISEVALSIVLLIGAGLMMRSFFAVMHVDMGFDPDRILAARLALPPGAYNKPEQQGHFLRQVLERVRALPGVAGAAVAVAYPFEGGPRSEITIPGRTHSEQWNSLFEVCSDGYFQTLQIPLLRGSYFTRNDDESLRRVAIINQAFARKYFGTDDPIGQSVKFNDFDQWPQAPHNVYFEIIGVTGDIKNAGLRGPTLPEAYLPSATVPGASSSLLVRTSLDPASLLPAIRRKVWAIDRNVALGDDGSLTSFLQRDTYGSPKFEFIVMGALAVVGTLLVIIGIFSVMAYTVSLRTHEIGVRMSLGAQKWDVLRMVLRQGLILIAAGCGLGLLDRWGLTRYLADQVWGVSTTDPSTYGAVVAGVILVGLGACFIPARRAAKVDPMVALRYE
jgi:putative ABC transport system permease protein